MAFGSLCRHLAPTTPYSRKSRWLNTACPPRRPMSLALMAPVLGKYLPTSPNPGSQPDP